MTAITHPFAVLAPEYAALLAAMRVDPGKAGPLGARAGQVLDLAHRHRDEWVDVEGTTGVPRLWGIASFERESGSDYTKSPAQGDPWNSVSRHVPRGLGPYKRWGDACVAAYRLDRLDQVGAGAWTWPRACYEGEAFNGFGPREHGIHTGYLWSWSNIYSEPGKYVADRRWDPHERDQQCGMIPMMAALMRLEPALGAGLIGGLRPESKAAPAPVAAPLPPPVGIARARWVQDALNRLGETPPLAVDGSYGRATRRSVAAFQAGHGLAVDGLAGPLTSAAIEAALAAKEMPASASA